MAVWITERMEEDDYVLVCLDDFQDDSIESGPKHLNDVNDSIEKISNQLWLINKKIHDNPELGYEEHKAHALLTKFLKSKKGWEVTTSAYGMETAWVAVYDSGRSGPVVSLNVEMGKSTFPVPVMLLTNLKQTLCPKWAMHAGTTSSQLHHWPAAWQRLS